MWRLGDVARGMETVLRGSCRLCNHSLVKVGRVGLMLIDVMKMGCRKREESETTG